MSLIITKKLQAGKAQDAQGDEVIAQKNGYKLVHNTLNDGYWFYTKSGAGWGITATNKVAAVNEFNRLVGSAQDAAEFHVGQRVRAKDPAYEYSDGKELGAGMFTVKEVRNNGDVRLDDHGDVWISPKALVEANDACGNGKDRCGRDGCGKDGNSEYELGMKVLKAVGKVEDEIGAGVRRAKQLVNNVPDEDVRRRLNRKLDDIEKIADSFEDTFI